MHPIPNAVAVKSAKLSTAILLGTLGDVHLSNFSSCEYLCRRRILDKPLIKANLRTHLEKPIPAIHPTIRQHNGVVLDIAFGVVRIWQVASKLI